MATCPSTNGMPRGWSKFQGHKLAHYYPQSNAKSICGRVWNCQPRADTTEPNVRVCPYCFSLYWAIRRQGY